jgi:MFS family permease
MAELTNLQKLKGLPWQFAGHVLTTVFIRTDFYGGALFMLFLSELKLDKSRIGFLISLLTAFSLFGLFCAPLNARVGFKRSYMTFVIGRLFFVSPLLFLPLVVSRYGTEYGFWLLVISMSCFAIIKTFGEVAWVPWQQEIVPDAVRGKFGAIVNIGTMASSIIITVLSGYLVGKIAGLTPFMIMIYIGLFAGMISIWCFAKMPGGAPVKPEQKKNGHFKEMLESLTKDSNYLRYNIAVAIVFIGFNIASTFVSLFLKEEVGLPSKVVVWLDIANFAGSMLSCYFWGWASDRYGSKPVMLMGSITWLLFPLICIFMPQHHILSIPFGFLVQSIIGIGGMGWVLGINRYLYVTAMPPEKKTGYSAVYYTNQMLAVCIGPLVSGLLIDKMSSMRTWLEQYSIQPYTPVFLLGFAAMLCGIFVMGKVHRSNDMPLFSFIKLFLRPDIFKSCFLITKYRFAISENQRTALALQLGIIKNPLVEKEFTLLRNDPYFDVRFAAEFAEKFNKIAGGVNARLEKISSFSLHHKITALYMAYKSPNDLASKYLNDVLVDNKSKSQYNATDFPVQIEKVISSAKYGNNKTLIDAGKLLIEKIDLNKAKDLIYSSIKIIGKEEQFYSIWKKLQHDPGTVSADILWNIRNELASLKYDTELVALAEYAADKFGQNEYAPANDFVAQLSSKLFENDYYLKELVQACSRLLKVSAETEGLSFALICCLIKSKFERLDKNLKPSADLTVKV